QLLPARPLPPPQQAPLQPSPVKRTVLQKADVPGTDLEIIYATVEIAPPARRASVEVHRA
ncbi:MAG: hypothetical protein ABI639_16150, partial [Thermoanaerobaculia bacterium]